MEDLLSLMLAALLSLSIVLPVSTAALRTRNHPACRVGHTSAAVNQDHRHSGQVSPMQAERGTMCLSVPHHIVSKSVFLKWGDCIFQRALVAPTGRVGSTNRKV